MNTCYNPFSLSGKTILVTGASSGIGEATATECSKLGASLIITGRNSEKLQKVLTALEGEGHRAIVADVTDDDSLKSLIDSLDKIDGAVLCAGISMVAPVQFNTKKKFQAILDTNLYGCTETIRLLLKGKKLSKEASIVAISSVAANTQHSGNSMYGAGKAALSQWMKYAAREYKPKGIRFNCILPGMTMTPLISGGAFSDEQLTADAEKYLHKRYGNPSEIALAAVYLLSDAAKWITGTDLIIDGGISLG